MILRDFKIDDAPIILGWIKSKTDLRKWSADRYRDYPASPDEMAQLYAPDNMTPLTAEDEEGNIIDNPYTVEMIEEEQEITFYAVAQEEGKIATYAGAIVPIPALAGEEYELGDVDHSGGVDVEDVTILINAVLGNQPDIYYPENANCDGEGGIDVGDVTALITRVLNGSW